MLREIGEMVERKLALIDMSNRKKEFIGEGTYITKWEHELRGFKQVLYKLDIVLELYINPYYYENQEVSTYKLSIKEVADNEK